MITDLERAVIKTYGFEMATVLKEVKAVKAGKQNLDVAFAWEKARFEALGERIYKRRIALRYPSQLRALTKEYEALSLQ